jgi:pentapeptide MXKDX repeat protein
MPVTRQNFFQCRVTKPVAGSSLMTAADAAQHNRFSVFKKDPSMTISTRIALGISAAALSLSLALAPAAFAQDAMKKDDGMMKKDTMSKDDGMMKKDTMSKDTMKKDDGAMMKKDDGMKKSDGMSK